MLNYIWFGLMAVALVVAAFNGTAEAVTKATVDSASSAVQISIGLVGVMTLWLGIMRIAEEAGLVTILGRGLAARAPLDVSRVPAGHPAAGAIVVAIAANVLGLNNAATPLGIKAMEELQDLNGDKETATNPMVTFMAMTTSGVQLIPSTMIAILAAAGSQSPRRSSRPGSWPRSSARCRRSLPRDCFSPSTRRRPPPGRRRPNDPRTRCSKSQSGRSRCCWSASRSPACSARSRFTTFSSRREGRLRGRGEDHPVPGRHPGGDRDVPRLGSDGAPAGRPAAPRRRDRVPGGPDPARHPAVPERQRIAGAHDRHHQDPGPDSLLARMAATMYGSSETTFYVLAVYFGAIGVRRTRHAVPAALVGDVVAAIATVAVCLWMF
jgi:spore maturation protein A